MGQVEKRYGIEPPTSMHITHMKKNNLPTLRKALKTIVEDTISTPIRYVVCFEETTKFGGFCNTCSYEETVVDIYFKSSEGKLCKITYIENTQALLGRLIKIAS